MVEVSSADIMATLLILKAEVEDRIGSRMRMVFSGATEAHLLAQEISKVVPFNAVALSNDIFARVGTADVGVILKPIRPFPLTWDDRRM